MSVATGGPLLHLKASVSLRWDMGGPDAFCDYDYFNMEIKSPGKPLALKCPLYLETMGSEVAPLTP